MKGLPNLAGYVASKHGVIGLVRSIARELGRHRIRVNAVLPGNTNTPMFDNAAMRRLMVPDADEPTDERFAARAAVGSPFGIPYVEPEGRRRGGGVAGRTGLPVRDRPVRAGRWWDSHPLTDQFGDAAARGLLLIRYSSAP